MGADAALAFRTSEVDRGLAAAVHTHGPRLRAFVRRHVRDLADVDDIVQDTLLELVSARRLAEPIEHLAAWLVRVAKNRIIDRFRATGRHARAAGPDLGGEDPESRVLEDWLAPAAATPESDYARAVLAEELLAALEELPASQREVFIAHELEGISFKDMSEARGIAVNTLLGRKHAAVRHLRQRLHDIRSELDL